MFLSTALGIILFAATIPSLANFKLFGTKKTLKQVSEIIFDFRHLL